MARRSGRRGFASMNPERRRRIASEGGHASGTSRSREEDWNEYENEDYYEDAGYEQDDWEDRENDDRGSSMGQTSSGRSSFGGARTSASGKRGFGSMNPERHRRISQTGRQATSGTRGNDFYEESGRRRGDSARDEYRPEHSSEIGNRGGRARWQEDEDDDYGGRSRRVKTLSPSSQSGSRRGFSAMDPEKRRRISAKGGRASQASGRGRGQ